MNVDCMACVGGTNVREDMAKLQEGVHIVVGTPGRVFDMINRRALKTDSVKIFCLDEADEMLSRGFKDQIYEVFQHLPQDTQVVLLSATMPADVLEVSKKFMREPIRILVKRDELTLEGIKQFYIGKASKLRSPVRSSDVHQRLKRRNGNSTHCVISMRLSPLPRPSFSATADARSTGSPKSSRLASLLSLQWCVNQVTV